MSAAREDRLPEDRLPEDRLFERWCRRGDPAALGELFDATAPRLLRLAIHLVGDASEAEDLVQATFLAALEQRASVDPSRPVLPWLSSVLGHKAQQHCRRAARVPDAERLARRAVEDPSRPLETRELDGEVARALDALAEPYRAVLVLRLRHGMELADIAHVLERDPGTVRVQLHRGLEKLRATLPERLVSALLFLPLAPRGLELVREVVVQRAATVAAGGGGALVVGGLVAKKVGIAVGVALACLALAWLWRAPSAGARTMELAARPGPVAGAELVAPAPAPAVGAERASSTFEGSREPAAQGGDVLRGRVVDAETHEPIAGAELRLFAPRRTTALELVRAQPELFELDANGGLRTTLHADWPLVLAPSALARFGREPVTAFARPRADEAPLASARSASDGSFQLGAGDGGVPEGVLEGARGGYATRWRAVRSVADELVLELWREREARGIVRGSEGPVGEGLELVIVGIQTPPFVPETKDGNDAEDDRPVRASRAWGPQEVSGLGAWTARTDASGRFSARVGASSVAVRIVTPGWDTGPSPFQDPEGIELVVRALKVPSLHVFDAASGAPLERVRLLGREQTNRYVRFAGEFPAPGGFLEVPGGASYVQSHAGALLAFVVWSEGYAPARITLADVGQSATIEVPLEAGSVDALEGVVVRGGKPVAGAEVALLGHSPLQWRLGEEDLVDATRTTAAGRFHLSAAGGSYVLRVREDDAPFVENVPNPESRSGGGYEVALAGHEPYFERTALPAAGPLTLDLSRAGRVEVELVDTRGDAQARHLVVLGGADGRQVCALSDAEGRASFANLPPGPYSLYSPPVSGARTDAEQRELELAPAGLERVRIEFPADTGPRHARVVARDTSDYTGWRARFEGERWDGLAVDGTVPMDLNHAAYVLEVLAPDGRRWHLDLPKDAADGHVFELEAGSGRYRGVLAHEDGTPWAEVAVHALAWGSEAPLPRVSAVTDADGAFELPGLASAEYRLMFNTQLERSPWEEWSNPLAGVVFVPDAPPSPEGTWLALRIPESTPSARVHGVVERGGKPLADATLTVECVQSTTDGALHLGGSHSVTRTDERGAFELELPRTQRVTLRVFPSREEGLALTQELAPLGADAELRLVVP